MAASSSSSSFQSANQIRTSGKCDCGFPLAIRVSWTRSNPCRRFSCCPNSMVQILILNFIFFTFVFLVSSSSSSSSLFQNERLKCCCWGWVDPELPSDWYKNNIIDMHNKLRTNDHGRIKEMEMELSMYKSKNKDMEIEIVNMLVEFEKKNEALEKKNQAMVLHKKMIKTLLLVIFILVGCIIY